MDVTLAQYAGIDAVSGLPLAAGLLAAAARRDDLVGPQARFRIEVLRQPLPAAVAALGKPSVLGLSLYPWNAAYSLALARAARPALPAAFIVAGGPAVPRRPDSVRAFLAANPALDAVVLGEGERAFTALLRSLLGDAALEEVPSLAWRDGDGTIRFTTPAARVRDFDPLASPYLDGSFDELLARHPGRFAMAVCETNRGCPFACTFCDWSTTPQVVELPVERVQAEIRWVAEHGLTQICFADANFGIRRRDRDIAAFLAAEKRRTGAPRSCYFYLTKNNHRRNLETIDILSAAGIDHCVGLAVQDFDEGVLAAVRRDKIQSGEARKLGEICAARGIATHNELILGLPGQTFDSFAATVLAAMPGHPRHTFRIFLCRLIDDTELASPESRERHGIESRTCAWPPGDAAFDAVVDEQQEIVVATRDMPVAEWRRTCRFAFLAAAGYNQRLLRHVLRFLAERGVDRRAWLEALCAAMEPGSGFPRHEAVGRAVDRLLDSMLQKGPLALPVTGHGATPHELAETVTLLVLADVDAWYEEVRRISAAQLGRSATAAAADELLRFHALSLPRFGDAAERTATFEQDWLAYVTAPVGARPAARPTAVRFRPPAFVQATGRGEFASLYLASCLAGLATGELAHAPLPARSA